IDSYFKSGWVFNNTLILFFDYLIPAQCIAIIFTFSIFLPDRAATALDLRTSDLNKTVTVIILILLLLCALFFAGNEIIKPKSHTKIKTYEYITQTARTYMKQAEEASDRGQLKEALTLVKKYLALKPEDEKGLEFENNLQKRIDSVYLKTDTPQAPQNSENLKAEDLTYDEAVTLARSYLENENYYSAYYYSQLAAQLSERKEEARNISTKAWTELTQTGPTKFEKDEYKLFNQKKRGTDLLLSNKPIAAYYLFNELKTEYPNDKDINKYLVESTKKILKLTFFIDDAEKAISFPGTSNICFLNQKDEEGIQLCFIGKMVEGSNGTFFKDIETISLDKNSGITCHMTAPYGKLVDRTIILNGIDRENSKIQIFPEYQTIKKMPDFNNTVNLNIDPALLHGLSTNENIYKTMSIIELIEFEPILQNYGWPEQPLYIELMDRILSPCSFMILSLFMIAIAWKYRKTSRKLPITGFIFSPIIFFIITIMTRLYLYASKLLCSWIFLSIGKTFAILLLTFSQILILIIAFFLIAGMNPRRDNERY
ncbi:MAG: LptF/LptG family permease, partial [Spirochaetales bacterium]|nr:LptF/LptG family permease [Spirochaetales bacterium]